jgi:uncharacterized protein DUF4390
VPPLPAPRSPRLAALCVAALLVLAGSPARAFELALGEPRPRDGWLWVDVTVTDPFEPRVEQSLTRGMPATLDLHAELWRRRTAWFHRLDGSFDAAIRIRYEVANESFRLERAGDAPMTVGSLDSLRAVLSRPIALPLGKLTDLRAGRRYYVVVSATLRPLTVEDIQEVEGWLSGEVEEQRRSGFGVITALPRSVFDAVRNFAGFGDEKARAISPDFDLEAPDLAR